MKGVQADLGLRPFLGQANDIFDEIEARADWDVLGYGSHALSRAGVAANGGSLTIGVWKNPKKGGSGHVAIITAYLQLQVGVLGFGLLPNGDVGVGVFLG